MAAVQARRARHILPRLSADGTVEYALLLPRPGQRRTPQLGSGADLDWVLNGGRRVHSSHSDVDLTDNTPQQRRMVSAGKGKNKLPWERSALSVELQSNGKTPEQVSDDIIIITHTPEISGALGNPIKPRLDL